MEIRKYGKFLCLIIATTLAACSKQSLTRPVPDESINHHAQPITALHAYRNGTDFFFELRHENRPLYAWANWSGHAEKDSEHELQNYKAPTLVPIHYSQPPTDSLPSEAGKLPVIGADKWQLLRSRLFGSAIPRDKSGLVMNFEHDEYFLFHDHDGKFQATRLVDKPGDYRIKAYWRFEEFIEHAGKVLHEFLVEHGITHHEFVFNTGDTGLYSLPFLYVNTDKHQLVFFRNMPPQTPTNTAFPGLKSGQTVGHVLHSHLSNIYTRPVSSLFQLISVISDTAVMTAGFEWATALSEKPVPPLRDAAPMDLQAWESVLDQVTKHPRSYGTIDFLIDGEAFFTRFIDTVSAAKKSVHLQTYIFDNDDYAMQIADLLKRRSRDGVNVKVLLDGLGTITATMADSSSLPHDYKAPASVRLYLEEDSKVNVRQKTNPWLTSDHVKSTIIDQNVAFVGGMNIGREYRYDWHDMMLELRGPVVDDIEKEFLQSWAHAGPLGDFERLISRPHQPNKHQRTNRDSALRLLLTSPGNYEIFNTQLEAIRRAQSYIYIQNAYITNDLVLRELVNARRRGVDVRVITPIEADHGPITSSNILAVNVMLQNGIRVYIYPGFSHVKAAVYDGWVCVGSANFDRLSLRINRELNIASSDPEIAQNLLDKLFLPDFQRSPELTQPLPERWVDYLVEIVSDYVY